MAIFLIAVAVLAALFFALCRYCYWYAFEKDPKRQSTEYEIPPSRYREKAIKNIFHLMGTPFEDVEITSRDSLKLYGRYYHFKDGAPLAIIFHGYRSNAFRDGNGGFRVAENLGFNILLPDQRAHGKSEGSTITFGVNERFDCALWVDYLINRFGKDVPIVLIGLSMGAATVMMASDIVPKENVRGIIADCGFSSPKEILLEVAQQRKFPVKISYFLLKIGARIFGNFDIESSSAVESVKNTPIPILFIHGEGDGFVPCSMSRICHSSCRSKKMLFTVKDATHGMSYYVDTPGYTKAVTDFISDILKDQ